MLHWQEMLNHLSFFQFLYNKVSLFTQCQRKEYVPDKDKCQNSALHFKTDGV